MSLSGKYLEAKIGSMSPVYIAGNFAWSAEEGGDVLDATVGEDEGAENEDMGVESLHVTIRGYFDLAGSDGYSSVRRGIIISNLKLYADKDSTVTITIPSCLVVRSRLGGEVRGKMEWEAEVHSKGTYTYDGL